MEDIGIFRRYIFNIKNMFTQEEKQNLKKDGMNFEDIQDLEKRVISHKNGTAQYLDEDTFWKEVYADINAKMKKQHA